MFNVHYYYYLRKFLLSKNENYEKQGLFFSNISKMSNIFITNIRNMTYNHYLQQPKPMIEWKLILLAKNPRLIRVLGNTPHPLIRKYYHLIDDN